MTELLKIYMFNPTEECKKQIDEFFTSIHEPIIHVGTALEADIVIDWPTDKLDSEPGVLHAGGRISCPVAFAAAHRMGIERIDFGKLMNLLKIKIHGCQLGCFK
jgi:hypothetical protein